MYNLLTPWPPQANGIADYSFEVAQRSEHSLVVVTRALHPASCGEHVGITSDAAARRSGSLDRRPNVYHFGNNADHTFLVPLFMQFPGVAVVHDIGLHYLIERVNDTIPGFFDAQLAEQSPRLAESLRLLWRKPEMKRSLDFQEFKMLGWLRDAKCIVVHSEFAARAIAPHLPGMRIHVVPHFAYRTAGCGGPLQQLRAAARKELKIGEDTLLIATVGFVTRNKLYDAVMRATSLLPRPMRSRVTFLIAGEERPHEYDLRRDIEMYGCADLVRTTGFLTEYGLNSAFVASDLIISLRYPTYGESSGSVARALGMGCALAVTNGGSYAELPEGTCFKVPAKPDPSLELAELIRRVSEDPGILADMRRSAAQYAREYLDSSMIARRYSEIACG
jgi:glycosyltransferase involved in cell wall biosynthesis